MRESAHETPTPGYIRSEEHAGLIVGSIRRTGGYMKWGNSVRIGEKQAYGIHFPSFISSLWSAWLVNSVVVFTSIKAAVFWSLPSYFTKAHGSPGKDWNASYLTNAFIKWKKRGWNAKKTLRRITFTNQYMMNVIKHYLINASKRPAG